MKDIFYKGTIINRTCNEGIWRYQIDGTTFHSLKDATEYIDANMKVA